ncbi:MAG TPA: tetratricopeptide repeat protein, partial [Pyrinomonadaceae bacterium]|nr:tetratricopeptide repeat protein [Pyrinomonadaceae bacterium]
DKFAAAHWGLARAYEGLLRYPEMHEALLKTISLDASNLEARIKLGNVYMIGGRGKPEAIAEAERLAKEVLQKDPNNIEGHILLATVRFQQNQKDEALKELNHAIQLDPNRVESYLSMARFYVATKDFTKAEELLRKAISVNNNSPVAHSELGKFLVQTNRSEEGEAELKKAVEVGPTDRNALFVLASYYYVSKQLDKAEQSYKALADLDKDKPQGPVVLADFYSAISRLDEAIKIYQDVLAKSPDYMQGRYRLGEMYLIRGDVQNATAQVDEALKKDPRDRQALVLRARIRSIGAQPEGLKAALEDLNEVLHQEPNSRPGLYFIAQTHFALGNVDQARNFAADLERAYPDYLPAKLMNVQISVAGGDTKTAIAQATDLIERLNKTAPDTDSSPQLIAELKEKTLLARGTANLQLGDKPAARQDLEAARAAAPNDPEVYNGLAMLSLSENKRDEAIGLFEGALKVDATNFNALSGLTNLYAQSQELDKAHARIDQVLSSNPNKAPLHFLKAQIYGYQRNSQGAEAELRKALELDPNYLAAYSALGALFINSGQEERAIAEYRQILERRPDNSTAYTLIGMLEYARKNYDAAIDNYRKALEKDQNAVIAANNLAWLYAVEGKGNIDEAVRLAQGVVQKNPRVAGFIDTLGWVYYKKGLHSAAVEQLQQAVKVDEAVSRAQNVSPSATYHFHLGMALKAKGDKQGARRELEAALKLGEKIAFPDADEARKVLPTL